MGHIIAQMDSLYGSEKFFLVLGFIFFTLWPSSAVRCLSLSEKLLFVGEDVRVLSLASKHPEHPQEAPAVSQVITAREIYAGGFRTLAELLRTIPGLYVDEREADVRPYFRGVPEGFLLLYDGVPFTTDSTKALYNLGEEISLAGIARVEIVRGPGSVLWGPDAFAGLINLVPKKSSSRSSTEILLGSPLKDFSANFFVPIKKGSFKGGLNLYYYGKDRRNETFSFPGEKGEIGRGEFYEAIFNLSYKKRFRLFGRFSQFRRPFVMEGLEGFSWPGERKSPVNFLKFEGKKEVSEVTFRTTLYYQYLYRRERELFLTEKQKNYIFYGELLCDRSFQEKSLLLTLGISWRRNYVRDATVSVRGYLPEFLKESNRQFRPLVETADFETDLYSAFFQLRKKFRRLDFWLGWRFSDHDHYEAVVSHQAGLLFRISPRAIFKLNYGTSYRTPYSAQFLGKKKLDEPEKMRSLGAELRLNPRRGWEFFISPFYNRISHHIAEDPFGGYSKPLTHYFLGLETGFRLKGEKIFLAGAYTWLNDWGEDEEYQVVDYIIIRPGSPPLYHYSYFKKPFSRGPQNFGHFDLGYREDNFHFRGRLNLLGGETFHHLKSSQEKRLAKVLILDLTASYRTDNHRLEVSIKNLFDQKYYAAGKFSPVEGERFGFFIRFSKFW